jgi:hypothetical protein
MIDSNIVIQYTNALYSTATEFAPRYDEFRDMFSSGQIRSKEWAITELLKLDIRDKASCLIVGAWYGTLGIMMRKHFPNLHIGMIDIDPRCEVYVNNILHDKDSISYSTADMYAYTYIEDIIINTSCEHIPDINGWLSLLPAGSTVVLQSNNFVNGPGHINCVSSEHEFIEKSGLVDIKYAGALCMPMYTRYMIIGNTQ